MAIHVELPDFIIKATATSFVEPMSDGELKRIRLAADELEQGPVKDDMFRLIREVKRLRKLQNA